MMEKTGDLTGPLNLGNPSEFTIQELAEKIQAITNTKSKIVYKSLPEDDPKKRRPDISLAKQKLEWEPKVDLEEGLLRTVDYFSKILSKKAFPAEVF